MSLSTASDTKPASDPAAPRRGWLRLSPTQLVVLVIAWLIFRGFFSASRQLAPDEAYYWEWSRHPAMSYFDHPPMVAWMIQLGTAVAGTNEFGVRWPVALIGASTILAMSWAAWKLVGNSIAAAFVPVALLTSPIINVTGSIVTPDAPACFFQALALLCVLMIFKPGTNPSEQAAGAKWKWLGFGILMGLALISKYTSVLLGVSVLLALIFTEEGRRHLRTIWPWISAVLCAAAFTPVIVWNAQHDWASFRFQLHHGVADAGSRAIPHLLEYIGAQIGIWTPVVFGVCMAAVWSFWRRNGTSTYMRVLLLSATLPLVFFAVSSLRGRVEANWPMFAFFPAVFLTAHYLAEHFDSKRLFWADLGVKIALAATLIVHVPEAIWAINPAWGISKLDELYGWRELAKHVDQVRGDHIVFGDDYQYASELAFYMTGRPEIWPLPPIVRPSAFEYFPCRVDVNSCDHVLAISGMGRSTTRPSGPGLLSAFTISQYQEFSTMNAGRMVRKSLLVFADKPAGGDNRGNGSP